MASGAEKYQIPDSVFATFFPRFYMVNFVDIPFRTTRFFAPVPYIVDE
jgi:hypothetical protein